jgi:succinyl-CoA synthetase beta subunit
LYRRAQASVSLRLSKKEGIPIQLVAEGTPGASVVAVKRVDELGFYNLGARQLAEKVGLTMPKAVAVVDYLGLRKRTDCYKEFKIGKSVHKRYSQGAVTRLQMR